MSVDMLGQSKAVLMSGVAIWIGPPTHPVTHSRPLLAFQTFVHIISETPKLGIVYMQLLGLLFPSFLRTWWWGIFLCKFSDMINDLLIIIWNDIGPDQVLSLSS